MPSTAPRLMLIDQSLTGFAGHHYEYDLAVLSAARTLGLDACLAAHRDFPQDRFAGAPVVGRFSAGWNEEHHRGLIGGVRRVLGLTPPWLRLPLLRTAALMRRKRLSEAYVAAPLMAFGERIAQIVDEQKLTARDHVLIHTLGEGEFLGLVEAFSERAVLPHLHIVLRRDLEDDARAQASFRTGMEKIRARRPLAGRVHFYSDTEPLAEFYRGLGKVDVAVLPIPHCLPPAPQKEGTGPLTLAYLGGARGEKGYDLLPGLVESLAGTHLKTGRARFLIQSNYAMSLEEPLMARARARLAAWPKEMVEIIDEAPDVETFQALLFSADIMLLPYRAELYRRRSSGLLVQAAAAGIPTIVPEGTWLAAEAPQGAHVVFAGASSLAEATRAAIENYPALRAVARAAAPGVRESHDAGRLVRMVVGRAVTQIN